MNNKDKITAKFADFYVETTLESLTKLDSNYLPVYISGNTINGMQVEYIRVEATRTYFVKFCGEQSGIFIKGHRTDISRMHVSALVEAGIVNAGDVYYADDTGAVFYFLSDGFILQLVLTISEAH